METIKVFFRRVKRAATHRLGLGRQRFIRNQLKLTAATAANQELIDLMPGIELPMIIHPEMYFKAAYTDYVFEPDTLDFIQDHLEPGQTFIDIGANIGYFSLFCSKLVNQSCRVIAFEPGEFAFELLKRNKEINQCDNLEIINAGLGERDELINYNSGLPGMEVYNSIGSIVHPSADPSRFLVTLVQLFEGTTWLKNHNIDKVDIMKIDVEGGEFTVLKGMYEMFKEQRVSRLLIEITHEMSKAFGYHPSEIISMIADCGYSWFTLHGGGRLEPLRDKNLRRPQKNTHMFVAVLQKSGRRR